MTDIAARADQVLIGTFMARATYGAEYIDPAFWVDGDDDAEKFDDYRGYLESQGFTLLAEPDLTFNDQGGDAGFTANGLYNARVETLVSSSRDAQGLLAVKDGDTLVLAFRGTDGQDPAVETGQAFTGAGLAAHYKGFKALIDAAYDYLADHPEVTEFVVSGHSLGGAMADVFTLVDAARFRALLPDGLTIVSLASSGIPPTLPGALGDEYVIDETAAVIDGGRIQSLILPDDYLSISNSRDRAHFPNDFPDIPEDFGLVPIVALKDNLQFGSDTLFSVPNIANSDVNYYPGEEDEHPFDFRGMGAEHNSSLIWANVQGLLRDVLLDSYDDQRIIAGNTDYRRVADYDGSPIRLFEGYLELDNRAMISDRGDRALQGTVNADYILGLDGDDRIVGSRGNDLLSGGRGEDTISGGGGSDIIAGGRGRDVMAGGNGGDRFAFFGAGDSETGSADLIGDFDVAQDKVVLSSFDAVRSTDARDPLTFIGMSAFTGLGQIRAVQNGENTLLRIDLTAEQGHEMTIVLKNVDASTLSDFNFIL